ncbi:protein adenylyltransferase SelO [Sulfurirhabdus autotrophica]|uniref:Protein nucleotidyltransferase YdiU n=1 Tax=Sulfurirhabdus autotrophica TaxID=1706046 RepID=A0A4R3XSA6_9PROT|nr:protein adenylyltransferase SelO family protein [Sulfurirhabdus autotrophica]TCV80091.1 uncharacterized protein YdiU (UPF0061 family) [Sulfurirhabdus autotrophica]
MDSPVPLSFTAFLQFADYSLLRSLTVDPEQARHAPNKMPRQVKSGHYVEVLPTPLPDPHYVIHSLSFFRELGLSESAASEASFMQFFTGDPTVAVSAANADIASPHVRASGWASGYALSIYGQEMYHNCPFKNGNGYGDGRAISVLEVLLPNGHRWEFQLKGGGRTPYCRGGDGRAVLRSSIREFLASEAMAAMGVPTSRALCLFVSRSETISRPWYSPGAKTEEPDRMVDEPAAITTRAAPSFLRVGQLELFGRRARKNEHPRALAELEAIFLHALEREYPDIAAELRGTEATLSDKVIAVAREFGARLSRLAAHWIRVGYCQGNFNSDNCAVGGWTLDYGPFGFMEAYNPMFQMWIGGGEHFSFMNQPMAAATNFQMFCMAVTPLLGQDTNAIKALGDIVDTLPKFMNHEMYRMWAEKMGLAEFRMELFAELHALMTETPVDYTIFWRELSSLPKHVAALRPGFYETRGGYAQDSVTMEARWTVWLQKWHAALEQEGREPADVSAAMKRVNPKYIPREWMMVEAYRSATDAGDFSLVQKLHDVLADPYGEQSEAMAALYYKKKEEKFFDLGGTSHCSCSS